MTLDNVRAIYLSSTSTPEQLEEAAAAAQLLTAAATDALARLNALRPELLISCGDDEQLVEHDRDAQTAALTQERAAALESACRIRATDIRAEVADRARRERYEAVSAMIEALPSEIVPRFEQLKTLAHAMLTRLATAQLAVDEVNASLPDGYARLPDAETFRMVTNEPGGVVSVKSLELWVDEMNRPLPPEEINKVKLLEDGRGWRGEVIEHDDFGRRLAKPEMVITNRRRFVEVVTRAARNFRNPQPFAAALSIPPLFGETQAVWRPLDRSTPPEVLKRLDEVDLPLPELRPAEVTTQVISAERFERDYAHVSHLLASA